MRITTAHNIFKGFFGYLAVLVSNSKKIGLQKPYLVQKWQFLYFKPILSSFFATIATVKFKQMPKFYTSVTLLINQSKEIGEKQFELRHVISNNVAF